VVVVHGLAGAGGEQHSDHARVSVVRSLVQRGPPAAVLGWRSRPADTKAQGIPADVPRVQRRLALQEALDHADVAVLRGAMQWCHPAARAGGGPALHTGRQQGRTNRCDYPPLFWASSGAFHLRRSSTDSVWPWIAAQCSVVLPFLAPSTATTVLPSGTEYGQLKTVIGRGERGGKVHSGAGEPTGLMNQPFPLV